MAEYLVFRLYGAMAAWGDIAVGEQRPSTPHPSKSAVLGLLAAALGIRRHEDRRHQVLAQAYGFSVRLDTEGVHLRDYHTSQIPKNTNRLKHLATRRNEMEDRENLYTVLSSRDYRCDGLYTICVWGKSKTLPYSLRELVDALHRPRFTLYLGRKSCPLAMPLSACVVSANTLDSAFHGFDKQQPEEQRKFLKNTQLQELTGGTACYWDDDAAIAPERLQALHTAPRHDEPLSRQRRQFTQRDEHFGRLKGD